MNVGVSNPSTNGDRPDGQARPTRYQNALNATPGSAGKTLAALGAEAVARQVVVAASRAHHPPRRLVLDPAVTVAPVPQAVSGSENPLPALRVAYPEVADGGTEGTDIHASVSPPVREILIEDLGPAEGINRHYRQI